MPGPAERPRPPTPGELWTHEQLRRLHDARFSPRDVRAFLGASWQRSAEVRRRRPELSAQAHRWLGAGAGLWLALAAARVPPFRRAAPAGAVWWGATAMMLDWHLGMIETEDGRPRPLGLADALTLARAWLVPVVFAAPGPFVCAVGAATDALDGVAARRGQPTRAGRDLEGLVDSCFTVAAIAGLRRDGRVGRTPARAELCRLGGGFAYATFRYFVRAEPPDRELIHAARASTAMRVGGLVLAASGRRRLGDGLVAGGCVLGLGLLARAALTR